MKNIFKKTLVLLLSVITLISTTTTTYAETAKEKFKAKHYKISIPIKFATGFNVAKTTDGKYVYCMQFNKDAPVSNITYTKGNLITDNGLNYILKEAYNIKSDKEYFIYKSAVWLYMVDKKIMDGTYYMLTEYYANVKKSNTKEAKQILELIANAKKAGANDTTAPTIQVNTGTNTFVLDSTGKYYVSNEITVNSSTNAYNVNLTKAPEGSTTEITGNTFVIKVPVDKVNKIETSINFTVDNTKDVYTAYKYKPNNSSYQPIAAMYKETKTSSASGSLMLKRTVAVPFLKVDAETGEAISGAELTLKNSKDEVVKSWTSSTKEEIITNLDEGSYTLIETKAPEGYNLVETSIKFSIDSEGNILDANGQKVNIIKITNEKKKGSIYISKQDITTGKELPGATLVVKDYDGNIIDKWISTTNPHYIEKLTPGIYTLTETIAPEGYILSDETITFTVEADGTIKQVVMYNTPNGKEIPVEPTSSFKSVFSQILSIIITITGGLMIFNSSKKKVVNK